jgi:Rrf2 family iron-sulfur cluster assembly transcriptional regulator
MLLRRGQQAIQALLELAQDPPRWRSVNELAEAQNLPAPMLEQLLLQLRRRKLLEARRGRSGGYRLALPPRSVNLSDVLAAVEALPLASPPEGGEPASRSVTELVQTRLQRALQRELARMTLEELLFDLHSAPARPRGSMPV